MSAFHVPELNFQGCRIHWHANSWMVSLHNTLHHRQSQAAVCTVRWHRFVATQDVGCSVALGACRYLLSTSLSIYNKKLVGKNYGIFGKGSFPGARVE